MNDQPNAIMIFAAGFGTRMGGLTRHMPKPLIPVSGRPLIDHTLALTGDVNPAKIVANLHYLAGQMADYLTPRNVLLSYEPDILETGGGLRAALPLLGNGPVYTMNPDVIWQGPNPLTLLTDQWNPAQMDALLMCVPVAQALGRSGDGDFSADDTGHLRRGPNLIYGGVQILKTGGLCEIPDTAFSLNLLWDRMARKNRLCSAIYPGKWCDVGRPEGIALAETMLENADV